MNIQQLEYFLAAASAEHITNAAQRLHISQPALTAAIQRLESELGVRLFKQSGRNIKLTEFGSVYLKYAKSAVKNLKDGQTLLDSMKEREYSTVRLVTPPVSSYPGLINMMLKACPNLIMSNEKESQEVIAAKLNNNTIDLCISALIFSNAGIDSCVLSHDRMMLLTTATNPLANRDHISFSDLKDQPFSTFPSNTGAYRQIEALCLKAGFSPKITFIGERLPDVVASVSYCNTVAILTEEAKRVCGNMSDSETVWIPIDGSDSEMIRSLYWRNNESRNIVNSVRDIIINYFVQ